jgi:hypothetical protein
MNETIEKVKICPKCNHEIHGAIYYIRETKEWICMQCYFEDKNE